MTKLRVEIDGAWHDVDQLHVEEFGFWNLMGAAVQTARPSFVRLMRVPGPQVSGNIVKWAPRSDAFPFAEFYTNGNNQLDNAGMAPARIHNRSFNLIDTGFVNNETVPAGYRPTGLAALLTRLQWDVTSEGAATGAAGQDGAAGQQTGTPPTPSVVIAFSNARNAFQAVYSTAISLAVNDLLEAEYREYTGTAPSASNPGSGWTTAVIRPGNRITRTGIRRWTIDLPTPTAGQDGIVVRSRVRRPPTPLSIDSITVTPYTGRPAERQATVTATTTGGVDARMRITVNGFVAPQWGRINWSPWQAIGSDNTVQWEDIPLFWTGSGGRPVIEVQARNPAGTVSRILEISVSDWNTPDVFTIPQITWGNNAYELVDPDRVHPAIIIGLAAAAIAVTGGIAAIGAASASGAVIGGGIGLHTGIQFGVATTWAGLTAFVTTGSVIAVPTAVVSITGALGAAVGMGTIAATAAVATGSGQRHLIVRPNVSVAGTVSTRVRLGWRLLGGFNDHWGPWSSSQSGQGSKTFRFNNVVGGEGAVVIQVESATPSGATFVSVAFRIDTHALESSPPTRSGNTVTIRGYGMTAVRARYGEIVGSVPTPAQWSPWRTYQTIKSGRIGTATVILPANTGSRARNYVVEYDRRTPSHASNVQAEPVSVPARSGAQGGVPRPPQPHVPAPLPSPPPASPPSGQQSGPSGQQTRSSPWVYVTREYPDTPTTPTLPTPPTTPSTPTPLPPTDPGRPGPGTPAPPTTPAPTPTPGPVVRPTNQRMGFTFNDDSSQVTLTPTAVNAVGHQIQVRWGATATWGQPIPPSDPATRQRQFATGPFTQSVPSGASTVYVRLWSVSAQGGQVGPALFQQDIPEAAPDIQVAFSRVADDVQAVLSGARATGWRTRSRFATSGAWSTPSPSDSGGERQHSTTATRTFPIPSGDPPVMQLEVYAVNDDDREAGPEVFTYTISTGETEEETLPAPSNIRVVWALTDTTLTANLSGTNASGFRTRGRWGTRAWTTPSPADSGGQRRYRTGAHRFTRVTGERSFRLEVWATNTDGIETGPLFFNYLIPEGAPTGLTARFDKTGDVITVTLGGQNAVAFRTRGRFDQRDFGVPSPADSTDGQRRHRTGTHRYVVPAGGADVLTLEVYAVNRSRVEAGPAIFLYSIPDGDSVGQPQPPSTAAPPPVAPTPGPEEPETPGETPTEPAPVTPEPEAPDPGGGEVFTPVLVENQPSLSFRVNGQTFDVGAVDPNDWQVFFFNFGDVAVPTRIRFTCSGRESGAEHLDYDDVTMWPSPTVSPESARRSSVMLAVFYEETP